MLRRILYVNNGCELFLFTVQATGVLKGWDMYSDALDRACLYMIQASMVYSSDNSTDALINNLTAVYNQVANDLCTVQCNSGHCNNGTCQCDPGLSELE